MLDEAQFLDNDMPPKLDERMNQLAKKKPDHPAVKAYQRYRGGPEDTIRSEIITLNARMQPFDNEELLEIFSSNDIPLDEFGTGIDGDGKTKSNLFIIIPDDECIIFVRGENPIRDKKWFPWEHEEYLEARKCGAFNSDVQKEVQEKKMMECQLVGEESVEYLKKQKEKNENIQLDRMDAFSFMMMDLDGLEKKIHLTPNEKREQGEEKTIVSKWYQYKNANNKFID